WRVTSGGNLSISRDFFWEVGGYDESFRQWGGEDNEFGYRTFANGAVIVPESMALAWHQGAGHEPQEDERRSLEEQRPKLANLIPDPTIRRIRPGRSYEVPLVTVHVRALSSPKEQTLSVVESILSGRFSDLVVLVDMPPDSPDLVWMERQFQADGRVRVGSDLDPIAEIPGAHVRVELPTSVLLSMGTLEDITGLIWDDHLGAVHITNPNWDNSRDLIEVYTTRAWTRASRLDDDPANRSALIGRLFGERWISGNTYGFFIADADGLARSEQSQLSEVEQRDQQIRAMTSRRSLRIADAIGSVLGARSWAQFVGGMKQAGNAVLGRPPAG
ncbi:MAG: galactosyltransferase-related protein, partial [Acidimicrobiia bacterium]